MRAIVVLAVVLFVGIILLGFFVDTNRPAASSGAYLGAFFGVTSLLGIWAAVGLVRWQIRLCGLLGASVVLDLLFSLSMGQWRFENHVIVVMSTFVVSTVMVLVRIYWAELDRNVNDREVEEVEGLQFSISHLMLLTLAIAGLLALGQLLQPLFSNSGQMGFILAICLCFVSIGVMSAWAMLGRQHVILRSFVVVAFSLCAAFIPIFVVPRGTKDMEIWFLMMSVEAIVILGSLFVVRQSGFRMVRLIKKSNESLSSSTL